MKIREYRNVRKLGRQMRSIFLLNQRVVPQLRIPIHFFLICGVIILFTSYILSANIPALKPGYFWKGDNIKSLGQIISALCMLYPGSMVLGWFNRSRRLTLDIQRHFIHLRDAHRDVLEIEVRDNVSDSEYNYGVFTKHCAGWYGDQFDVNVVLNKHLAFVRLHNIVNYIGIGAMAAGLVLGGYTWAMSEIRHIPSPIANVALRPMATYLTTMLMGTVLQYLIEMFYNPAMVEPIADKVMRRKIVEYAEAYPFSISRLKGQRV